MGHLKLRVLVYFAAGLKFVLLAFSGEWQLTIVAMIFFCFGWLICRLHDEYERTST